MKSKSIIAILVLLILACGISFVSADDSADLDAKVNNHEFSFMEGFNVTSSNNTSVVLENGTDTITVYQDNGLTLDKIINKNSFEFLGEADYIAKNHNIHQENYQNNDTNCYCYSFDVDGDKFIIVYNFPIDSTPLESDENPVSTILDSLNY